MAQCVSDLGDNEKSLFIKNVATDQVIEVRAVKDPGTGKVRYENLP